MASLVSGRGDAGQATAAMVPAPPDLSLAVARLAGALGTATTAVVGSPPLALDVPLTLTYAPEVDAGAVEASRDGLAIVCGRVDWHALSTARAAIAFGPADGGDALETLARVEAEATEGGWRIAHAGLLVTAFDGSPRRECPLVVACRPEDEQLARLLENGPLSIALDPVARTVATPRPARVLIASYEVTGPTGNGGIGTAYHSLAHALAAAGHDVTVLFTGWLEPDKQAHEPEWRAAFAEAGIAFELLGRPWDSPVRSPHHAVRRAYELHRWLAEAHTRRPFDVVHVPECQGHGAFAQTAKALGLAYGDVEFVVGTHSSTRWIHEANREGLETLDQLVTEQLERLSVERADVLMSPSAYLVDYMRERGWRLPTRTFVQQYARPQSVRRLADAGPTPAQRPNELVFFGRLETRKGLEAFCEAVDLLVADGDCPFECVTLLGRPERVMGEDAAAFVERRAQAWGLSWEILPDLGHAEAIAYLRSHPCVVAIPSLVDNSPNTVSEAIALGVPFVASRSGGTAELIAPGDLATATFDGWSASTTLEPPTFADDEQPFDVRALATALRAKAATPGTRVSPAVDATACDRVYDEWHRAIATRRSAAAAAATPELPSAAVHLVQATSDDVARIAAGLSCGTRRPVQIVAFCDEMPPGEATPPEVTFVAAAGRDSGRLRDATVAACEQDVVIVLRGNEEPDPTLVERVGTAMAAGEADVLALVCRDADAERPVGVPEWLRRTDVPADVRAFVPAVAPAVATIAYPALSVGPYAIRREALARLGGFAHDLWGEALDHELLTRAALAGLRVDVLPDPLATTVRDDRWSALRSRYWGGAPIPVARGEEQIRLLRPFRRRLPSELADLPALLASTLRASGDAFARSAEHAEEREEIAAVYEARVREQRALIELYEQRQEEMRAALNGRGGGWSTARRLRHGLRRPVSAWPRRGARLARRLGRRLRAPAG